MKSLHCADPALIVAAATAFLLSPAFAAARQAAPSAPDTRTFAPAAKFAKDDSCRYLTTSSMSMTFKAEGQGAGSLSLHTGLEVTMRYKVREVKSDGTVVSGITSEGGKIATVSDEVQEIPQEKEDGPRSVTFDRQERIRNLKDPAQAETNPLVGLFNQSNLLLQMHFLALPEKPIKVGDSWAVRYTKSAKGESKAIGTQGETPKDGDDVSVGVDLTLLGTETLDGIETLKIKQVITIPSVLMVDAQNRAVSDASKSAGKVTSKLVFTLTVNALPETGRVLRSQGAVSGTVKFDGSVAQAVPANTMLIEGKVVVARLSEKALPPNSPPVGNKP